ncbi:MAG TPA: hypothetical protein VG965_07325 [Patescibacteria group bacterium]|nr:hypothetical protein [Patescibacteria group bacterium]
MNRKLGLALIAIVFLAFFAKSATNIDPDFGWHLRMGELILKSGIPATDPFSYTMPSFPFIDHEWGLNLLLAALFSQGAILLEALFAALATASLFVCFSPTKSKFNIVLLVLSTAALLTFAGVRTQVVSWFLLALFLKALLDDVVYLKTRFLIPILILFWANLHGSVGLPIVLLGVFLCVRIFQRKILLSDVAIFFASVLATLTNPYGIRLWSEILSQATDASLRFSISEWLPAVFFINFPLILLAAVETPLMYKYRGKILALEQVFFVFLFFLAVSSVRNVPYFILINLFVAPALFENFYSSLRKTAQKSRLNFALSALLTISLASFIFRIYYYSVGEGVVNKNYYPTDQVIDFLKQEKVSGNLFSIYNWGGYLDWKVPEKKVFVDGRMPSWRFVAPSGQSNSAFYDYQALMSEKSNYKKIFDKFNVRLVLLPKPKKKSQDLTGLIASLFIKNQKSFDLAKTLTKDGWRIVYHDNSDVVFIK